MARVVRGEFRRTYDAKVNGAGRGNGREHLRPKSDASIDGVRWRTTELRRARTNGAPGTRTKDVRGSYRIWKTRQGTSGDNFVIDSNSMSARRRNGDGISTTGRYSISTKAVRVPVTTTRSGDGGRIIYTHLPRPSPPPGRVVLWIVNQNAGLARSPPLHPPLN